MKFASALTGQGPAELSFSVEPNRSTSPRALELSVSEQRAVIAQQAAICHWIVSPVETVTGPEGGEHTVRLATEDFCAWSVSPRQPWIAIAPDLTGTGSAELTLRIARNEGGERIGIVEVPGGTISVRQPGATAVPPASMPPPGTPPPSGVPPPVVTPTPDTLPPVVFEPVVECTYDVNPAVISDLASTSTLVNVDVTSPAGCGWNAASGAAWLVVSTGGSGSGSGRVGFTVAENSGIARSGELLVAGRTVTVSQRGGCTYSVTPSTYEPAAAGGTVDVSVSSGAGCAWEVTGTGAWVSASPVSSAGSGTTSVTVQPNTGAARSATMKVAGRDLLVHQLAAPCSYSVSPAFISVSSKKQTRTIDITAQAHCPIAASIDDSVSWMRVESAPASGSGEIKIRIEENKTRSRRTAGVTIAGQDFTRTVVVTQDDRDGDDD